MSRFIKFLDAMVRKTVKMDQMNQTHVQLVSVAQEHSNAKMVIVHRPLQFAMEQTIVEITQMNKTVIKNVQSWK